MGTPEAGSPRGGVISPRSPNVYLHYVLDVCCRGGATAVAGTCVPHSLADDFVMGSPAKPMHGRVGRAAEAFRQVRFGGPPGQDAAGGFRPPAASSRRLPSGTPAGTFDLLGFTHHWVARGGASGSSNAARLPPGPTRTPEDCRLSAVQPPSTIANSTPLGQNCAGTLRTTGSRATRSVAPVPGRSAAALAGNGCLGAAGASRSVGPLHSPVAAVSPPQPVVFTRCPAGREP